VTKQSLIFNNQQCLVLVLSDITKFKRLAYVEYQNMQMKLRQSTVSHELVTPLKCIANFAFELLDKLEDPELIKKAKLIKNTSILVCAQMNDVLDKNLFEKDKMEPFHKVGCVM